MSKENAELETKSRQQLIERLQQIRTEAEGLTSVLWSQYELLENHYSIYLFHQRMKAMMNQIIINLNWYQKIGWKRFVPHKEIIEEREIAERLRKEKIRWKEWLKNQCQSSGFYTLFKNQVAENHVAGKLSQFGFRQLQDASILDVGCGDGRWLRQFVQWGAKPERLTGTEIYRPLLELAKSSVTGVTLLEAEPDELPFGDGTFDVILAFGILMYVLEEPLRVQIGRELLRVLSDDGVILTANPRKDGENEWGIYAAYTTKGLEFNELTELFADCQISFEELPSMGFAVIKKKPQT